MGTLNELHTGSRRFSEYPSTLAQRHCLDHIFSSIQALGAPEGPRVKGAPQRALQELLASSAVYSDAGSVQPYRKDLVSWPVEGFQPVLVSDSLSPVDRA